MSKKKQKINRKVIEGNLNDPTVGVARSKAWMKQIPLLGVGLFMMIYIGIKIGEVNTTGNIIKSIMNAGSINWGLPIVLTKYTGQTVLLFLMIYTFAVLFYISGLKKSRTNREKGSAEWGDINEVAQKFGAEWKEKPRILTKSIGLSYNAHSHMRNFNTLVIGGSGAGKTRFYAKPNLLQGNTSFVVLDPKGELLRDTGAAMKKMGYKIKVLNLRDMRQSDRYNPFMYLSTEQSIISLCTNLFKATGDPAKNSSGDPFWDNAAQALLTAIIALLYYEAPPSEQNFAMVGTCLRYAAITSESGRDKSPLDKMFDKLEEKDPDHIALKFYRDYHSGGAKTLQSIQITLAARLNKFNIEELRDLTMFDMLDLEKLGEEKTVLYAVIPDNDSSFNFVVSLLYVQVFQILMDSADFKHKGALPVHVHFLMDEFANVCLPDDFAKYLATIRSRGISVSIIIQNMSQLKALFEKDWESIVGNCDTLLYLGGNEQSTHEYMTKLLDKETIDIQTYNQSKGQHGSYTTNNNIEGRELLTMGEVRLIDRNKCLLFICSEKPIMDFKYPLEEHPNIDLGADGKYKNLYKFEANSISFDEDNIPETDVPFDSNLLTGIEGYSAEYIYQKLVKAH